MMHPRFLLILLAVLIILGVITGYWYYKSRSSNFLSPVIDKNGPNSLSDKVANPLNGVWLTESEKDKVLSRRPLVVMIGNNADARPPSGVSQADMVYEVVAEGGITRLMPIFLQNDPEKIGPVRSIRSYFLYWIMELGDAMVMHDGWSSSVVREASAIDLIDDYSVRSLFRGGLYGYRDNTRDAPNNEYIATKTAREHGDKLGWEGAHPFTSWQFKEDKEKIYDGNLAATEINIIFWETGDYDSHWTYNSTSNEYSKQTGGEPHIDLENGSNLTAKNVIVQFAKEVSVNDEKNHLLYENIGSGKALIFLDGKVVESTWNKKDMRERTMFYDGNGQEIKFNRGVIWISVVPDRNVDQVTYK